VHVRPPPVTVSVWAALLPCADTVATRSSFGNEVVIGGVWVLPVPSTMADWSMLKEPCDVSGLSWVVVSPEMRSLMSVVLFDLSDSTMLLFGSVTAWNQ